MTWLIIAPDHKVAQGWLRANHPDIQPYSNDIKIVTPLTHDKLRGASLREGDRLIRINDDWLPPTHGTLMLNEFLGYVLATSKVPTEWVEW